MKNYFQIFILFSMVTWLCANEPIALITKSRGNVKYNLSMDDKFNSRVRVNTPLFNGNGIKTKSNSFTKVVYLDDRSTIYVYPKTEIAINGMIISRMINKWVDITSGIVRIQVFNPLTSEFKLTTPHSELRCSSCDFWVISNMEKGDIFYKISGNALITNLSMSETRELLNDSTITSLNNTEMKISNISSIESKYLEELEFNAGESSRKSDEEFVMINSITNHTSSNILEIKLKNSLNIERKIVLTYSK